MFCLVIEVIDDFSKVPLNGCDLNKAIASLTIEAGYFNKKGGKRCLHKYFLELP